MPPYWSVVRLLPLIYSLQRKITEDEANARSPKQAASTELSDLVYVEFDGGIWHLGQVQQHVSDAKLAVLFRDNIQEIIDFESEKVVSAMERGAVPSGLVVSGNMEQAGPDTPSSEPPSAPAKPYLGRPHPLVRLRLSSRGSWSRLDQPIETEPAEPKQPNDFFEVGNAD